MRPALLALALLWTLAACAPVVVDSALTPEQAIRANQPPDAPGEVLAELVVVDVRYFGFDHRLHQGQVVAHRILSADVREAFAVIRESRFPLESVLPVAHPLVQARGPYGLSSDTGNSSAYAWRPKVGSGGTSLHGLGLALDLNPRLNPFRKGDLVLPPGATWDPSRPGTLTEDCAVVRAFRRLGWEWGGDWAHLGKTDFMHFQKIPAGLEAWARSQGWRPQGAP